MHSLFPYFLCNDHKKILLKTNWLTINMNESKRYQSINRWQCVIPLCIYMKYNISIASKSAHKILVHGKNKRIDDTSGPVVETVTDNFWYFIAGYIWSAVCARLYWASFSFTAWGRRSFSIDFYAVMSLYLTVAVLSISAPFISRCIALIIASVCKL